MVGTGGATFNIDFKKEDEEDEVEVEVVASFFFNTSSVKIFDDAAAMALEDISLSVRKLSPELPPLIVGLESI
jgi:hypothetical protein